MTSNVADVQREPVDPQGSGSPAPQGAGLERVVSFSDAVFAIVITLLVLPLTTEIHPDVGQSLMHHVVRQWPQLLGFLVSFLVIGQFWIAHHAMFQRVQRFDHGLLWLNLLSLLTVSFLPFPTAILGARLESDDQFPVVFYAACLTLCSVALTGMWLYARFATLVDPSIHTTEVRAFTARAVATSAVFVVSVGAAFGGLAYAMSCWLLVLPAVRIFLNRRTRSVT